MQTRISSFARFRQGAARLGGAMPLIIVSAFSVAAHADGIDLIGAARQSKPIIDLRLRSESVDQAGMDEDAEALTLRARLGFESGKAWDTTFLAESDLLWPLDGDYNDTVNGKTAFPIVADPESYEVNRLQLTNTSIPGTTLVVGRQRINLDDQRFVGSVGWRQNEQTFDGMRLTNISLRNLTVDVGYLDQVNRIVGKDSLLGRYHGHNYLANLSYQLAFGKLTGFAYLLDFDEALNDSSRTFGARFSGERAIAKVTLAYAASYATQREYADNPLDYEADYSALELVGSFRQYSLGGGVEVLQGDGLKGFSTPLATLHKFDGWADKFLSTPPDGLERRYVTMAYTRKNVGGLDAVSAVATYHDFESELSGLDYGTEIDLQLQAKWQRVAMMLKYADYRAQGFATDTNKAWMQIDFVW